MLAVIVPCQLFYSDASCNCSHTQPAGFCSVVQVKKVFANIGVSMTPEVFEELWKEAVRRDPKGQVCVRGMVCVDVCKLGSARGPLPPPPPPPR